MIRFKEIDHYSFYLLGHIILVIGLPWSPFLISLSQAILITNWLLEGNFAQKVFILKKRKGALLFLTVFLVHFVGLIYTTDFIAAFNDIKIKLPLLIFPLVISTTPSLKENQIKLILNIFIGVITISSIVSILALFGFTKHEINDIRDISLFISHIRFSLLINIGIFSTGFLLFNHQKTNKTFQNIFYWILLIWLTVFLFILQSLTGIIIFFTTNGLLLLRWSFKNKKSVYKFSGATIAVSIPILFITFFVYSLNKFYSVEKIDVNKLETLTQRGNTYVHDIKSRSIENGNYVWLYVCHKELKEEWNKRSKIKYDEKDNKGYIIKYTLIRYLTSKGFQKDADGVLKLTNEDVESIEKGIANYIYTSKIGLYPRFYQVIWEIDNYIRGNNPSGHSVSQRIEYYKSAYPLKKRD